MEKYTNTYSGEDASAAEQFARLQDILSGLNENQWLPTFTFATPGDIAVTYSRQEGFFAKLGPHVWLRVHISGTFTQTTSAGETRVSLPFMRAADLFREAWWAFAKTTTGMPAGDIFYVSARPSEQFAFIIGFPSDQVVAPANWAGTPKAFDIRFSGHYRASR